MKIIFKNVGQGDSVLLNWSKSGEEYIGIIDCNKQGVNNPTIDYLKTKRNTKIEFIILSHPHTDHFSGLYELLSYIEEKNIPVRYFLHTCASNPQNLQSAVRSISDRSLLRMIFILARSLNNRGLINEMGYVNNLTKIFPLTEDINLEFLAPSDKYIQLYNKAAFKNDSLLNNNPNANYLSTLIQLSDSKISVLLTSDTVKDVFWDFNRKGTSWKKGELAIGQIPHHGSKDNFYPVFWRSLVNPNKPVAAISFGQNSYGHPSQEVVDNLLNFGYQIETTGSIIGTLTMPPQASTTTNLMNMISNTVTPSSPSPLAKDLEYDVF